MGVLGSAFATVATVAALEYASPSMEPEPETVAHETTVDQNQIIDSTNAACLLPAAAGGAQLSNSGGIFGDIMGAMKGLAADVADAGSCIMQQQLANEGQIVTEPVQVAQLEPTPENQKYTYAAEMPAAAPTQ